MIVKEKIGGLFFDLIKGDTLIENEHIKDGSVDLILTDLPYGTMKGINETFVGYGRKDHDGHLWDNIIDTEKVMKIANRILRKNGKMILFAQDPFSTELKTKALPNIPYNYSMIWEKNDFANALLSKKAPVNYYEDVLVFGKADCGAINTVREYLIEEKKKSNLTLTDLNEILTGKRKSDLIAKRYFGTSQWECPTKEMYLKLQTTGYFSEDYSQIIEWNKNNLSTFNLWEGNKYKSNILKYKKDYSGHHPTQKPVLLLEDLIKTFSNENDLVVDLTMGSGSTGVAAINTNRNFIGIEKDDKYFDIAASRIKGKKPNPNAFEKSKERGLFSFTDDTHKAD